MLRALLSQEKLQPCGVTEQQASDPVLLGLWNILGKQGSFSCVFVSFFHLSRAWKHSQGRIITPGLLLIELEMGQLLIATTQMKEHSA